MQEFAIVIVENFDNITLHQIEIKTESNTASNDQPKVSIGRQVNHFY